MPSLSKAHRKTLSDVTLEARSTAEQACRAALQNLAVHEADYRPHMTVEQRQLRNRLRARGRALGDRLDIAKGTQEIKHLAEDAAYEHWHRLLFTRFLTENGLLHTDEEQGSVPVTLEDCEELAPELGAKDGFDLACRFASRTLPGVFRTDDPIFELNLAQKDLVELRHLLHSLSTEIFTASDSLGWTYQFWQAQRKDEVNKAGNKIGADELPSVTQLFTEDYMVDFLLDNTLGAWHAGKVLAANPKLAENAQSEDELREAVALPGCSWKYLRFIQGKDCKWTPAAGTFDGWPKTAKELKCLDPCMGSGHFVVAMFERLVVLRVAEEKLGETAAVAAVIGENLFGLELDPRCTQIGAFNLALAAWRRVGHCKLPPMNLACSGLAPNTREADWLALAGEDGYLKNGMARLFQLFKNAPVLGSLINPRVAQDELLEAAFHQLQPLLGKALAQETKDDTVHEMAVTARGIAKAAEILAAQFTLVATNVPYLGQRKQDGELKSYCEAFHPDAKADLATCFIERSISLSSKSGTISLVTPQNWLFLSSYSELRKTLLKRQTLSGIARLGAGAFETIGGEVVNVALFVSSNLKPDESAKFFSLDVSHGETARAKANALFTLDGKLVGQSSQLKNPDCRFTGEEPESGKLLEQYTLSPQGVKTGDDAKWKRTFWELVAIHNGWRCYQAPVDQIIPFGGRAHIVDWRTNGLGMVRPRIENDAVGKIGVGISAVGQITATIYTGEHYDSGIATIVPVKKEHLAAIWAFCSSPSFKEAVRRIDQKVAVTNMTLVKVPFDLAHWQKVAAEQYPHGLPKPFSSDPTQWLFNGHPAGADQPLHVAVARLLSYQWPRQTGSSFPDCPALGPDGLETLADDDGIVCLPAINREQPAAARLRALLAEALGSFDELQLLIACGSRSKTLEDWLRDEFFEQHCALFHQRPFLWHIWDGRKDGFAAILNYHRLNNATLQKLTYTTLGNWIHTQEADAKADKPGAAERLATAQSLQAELIKILEGEAPYDIFVRWKPLQQQPIGWHPDLNDGVRLNIRPFLTAQDVAKKGAGILRSKPNINWDKDRGKEPQRPKADFPWFWCENEPGTDPTGDKAFTGNRWNDVHLTLARKRTAQSS